MTPETFELVEAEGCSILTTTESGFEQIPLDQPAKTIEGNDAGWLHRAKMAETISSLKNNLKALTWRNTMATSRGY